MSLLMKQELEEEKISTNEINYDVRDEEEEEEEEKEEEEGDRGEKGKREIEEINLDLKNHVNKLKNDDDLYLSKHVTIVPIDKEAPSSNFWFHGLLDRHQSEERLKQSNKLRCFLIRESKSRPSNYVLSYLALDGTFNHYKYVTERAILFLHLKLINVNIFKNNCRFWRLLHRWQTI